MITNDLEIVSNYKWITNKFFEEILQNHNNDKTISVKEFNVNLALAKGENYASNIIRASVKTINSEGLEQVWPLIIKANFAHDEKIQSILDEYDLFGKEIMVYSKILSAVDKLYADVGESDLLLAPK